MSNDGGYRAGLKKAITDFWFNLFYLGAENAYPRPRGERSYLSLTGHSVFDLANLVSDFPGHQRSQIGDSMKQSLCVKQKICQIACIHRSCVPRY